MLYHFTIHADFDHIDGTKIFARVALSNYASPAPSQLARLRAVS